MGTRTFTTGPTTVALAQVSHWHVAESRRLTTDPRAPVTCVVMRNGSQVTLLGDVSKDLAHALEKL